MTCTDFPHPAPTTARPDDSILFAALELSKTRRAASAKSWLVATSAPGEEKVDLHPLWRLCQLSGRVA